MAGKCTVDGFRSPLIASFTQLAAAAAAAGICSLSHLYHHPLPRFHVALPYRHLYRTYKSCHVLYFASLVRNINTNNRKWEKNQYAFRHRAKSCARPKEERTRWYEGTSDNFSLGVLMLTELINTHAHKRFGINVVVVCRSSISLTSSRIR